MEPVQLAAILSGAVLLASMVSVQIGVSVALIELAFGIGLGNVFSLDPDQSWLVLIAGFASVVLTFLASAEVDPDDFRERLGASVTIGVASFAGPFVVATLVALGPLGWTTKASLIAGTALSTTSLAVVYAVLVETGLNTVRMGKLIMSACFVTDMCTVIALSAIFLKPTVWFPVFVVVSVALIGLLPKLAPWFFSRFGDRVIEPEIKLVFAILFGLSSRYWSQSSCSPRSCRLRSRNAGTAQTLTPSVPTTPVPMPRRGPGRDLRNRSPRPRGRDELASGPMTLHVSIPGGEDLLLKHLVLDVNGT
jgi:Kef-type K+ transport system membrane component KefB